MCLYKKILKYVHIYYRILPVLNKKLNGNDSQMQKLRIIFTLLTCLLLSISLSACNYFRFPGVYKIDIARGNIIKEEDIAKLKLGMTKRQVRYVLGEPLIQDMFHPDRWDYFYSLKPGKEAITKKHFVVYFKDGKLSDYEGNCCTAEELEKDLKVKAGEKEKEGAKPLPDENEYSSVKTKI